MQRFIPRSRPSLFRAVFIAVAAVAAAWLLRGLLQPLVGDRAPYATFFAAVLLAGIFGGWRGGAAAALLGGLAGNFAFVGGSAKLVLNGHDGAALALFLAVGVVLVWLIHALTESLRRERELNAHLGTVSAEYRHRIKNLLAVIQAMIQQTGRTATSTAEFEAKLLGRLDALSRAQDLLLEGQGTVGLHVVVGESLKPFALAERLVQPTGGPDVHVPAESAVAISLLLNELATNAAKYGSLAVEQGRLRLGWTVRDEMVVLDWKELDGPPVGTPGRPGFGSRLIDRAVERSGGAAELHFEPDGVHCEIRMNLAAREAAAG
jgi:two-component sensor histidine kinase